jgi:hypothetical protein
MSGTSQPVTPVTEDKRVPVETQQRLREYWLTYGPLHGQIMPMVLWDDGETQWDGGATIWPG